MTETQTQEVTEVTETQSTESDKLYAGKFKTVEELENGYKNASKVFNANQELSKKLEEATKIPSDYVIPKEIELSESELNEIKLLAHQSDLSQKHFDKYVQKMSENKKAEKNKLSEIRQQLGEDKIELVKDFINKKYSPDFAEDILNKAIRNPDSFNVLLKQRENSLNSGIPGIDKVAAAMPAVTMDEIIKARNDFNKNPADLKARDRYISLVSLKNKR